MSDANKTDLPENDLAGQTTGPAEGSEPAAGRDPAAKADTSAAAPAAVMDPARPGPAAGSEGPEGPGESDGPDECPSNEVAEEHLERIFKMKVPIIVRIAQKNMTVGEILKLHIGTVIQFEQDAYQHIDLMVNNAVIGLGQPVKVGENFGLRITQIGDIAHTIKSLGEQPNPS
ncbi:MAG: FliM/FliN family flagellar motor switch protein [Sedimentisphaerales bacterium]|nr:FliM/FliN family flagellar motor switch protein [Sedimentisphaerales bacterium]